MADLGNKIEPKHGILNIPFYKGGKSGTDRLQSPIKLSANENPYGPSKKAIEAFIAAQHKLGVYPDSSHSALRSAIGSVMGIDPNRIICGAGSDELIHFLCQCYAGNGDEVVHTEHGFAMYRISALTVGAIPISVPEIARHADISSILRACNQRTKIVFLANPNNPTGTLIHPSELDKLADELPGQTLLVLDGAYAEYIENFDGGLELAKRKKNVFITRTFSKIHGLGSLRVGWGFGPEYVVEALQRVKPPFNISTVGQEVATAAIKDQEYTERCRKKNFLLREELAFALREINILSDASFANFLLLRFPNKNIANSAEQFLNKNGLIIRNVTSYGLDNCLRVSIGTSSDCEQVKEKLTQFQEYAHAI